jgi:hypothetical protein
MGNRCPKLFQLIARDFSARPSFAYWQRIILVRLGLKFNIKIKSRLRIKMF